LKNSLKNILKKLNLNMATQKEIKYHGYLIRPTSFRKEGKWTPRASIEPLEESQSPEEHPLTWQKKFDTREKADAFAIQGAQLYIGKNL